MQSGFYSEAELAEIGFKSFGENIQLSRKASIYNPSAISLGSYVRIDDFCILSGGKYIEIGSFVHIGAYSALFGGGGILIEDFSGMSPRCTLYSESDDFSGISLLGPMIPMKYKPRFKCAPIIIRRHAGLGTGSSILPGVELAEGSGPVMNSMVVKDTEAWSVYAGNPAEKISRRSKKILEQEKKFLADIEAGTAWDK